MLIFIREKHGKTYAENSRETVRRQVLHQLE
jgi:BsuBI/PstI restriction endonuclease HTH domain